MSNNCKPTGIALPPATETRPEIVEPTMSGAGKECLGYRVQQALGAEGQTMTDTVILVLFGGGPETLALGINGAHALDLVWASGADNDRG